MSRAQCTATPSHPPRMGLDPLATLNYLYSRPVYDKRLPCSSKSTPHSPCRRAALKALGAQAFRV